MTTLCAPWADCDIPTSGEFLGFYAHDITLNPVTAREVLPRPQVGGSVGALRLNSRTINVSGTMFAKTPRGMAYGERWLTDALRGSLCTDGCPSDELEILPACDDSTTTDDFRTLVNVGLVDGPIFTPLGSGIPECVLERASFVLSSTMPYLYGRVSQCLVKSPLTSVRTCGFTTSTWQEGTFVIEVENVGTTDATDILVIGRLSLDGSCPVNSPGTSVPPLFSYTIPLLRAGDKVTIDGTRRQAMYVDASLKLATSALPVVDFTGPWKWPDAPACQTTCVSLQGGSGDVTATVTTYIREL